MKYVGTLEPAEGFLLATSLVDHGDRAVSFSFLVDTDDGEIANAAFHARGPYAFLELAEAACAKAMRKRIRELERMELDPVIDEALKMAAHSLGPERHIEPIVIEGDGYPGFDTLPHDEKLRLIESVLDQEIRPFVEMDGGGVTLVGLNGTEVTIAYEGSCNSCFASTGSTLSAIQQMLQAKLSKELTVVPQFDQFMTE